jgi:hypothetical protein
MRYSLVCVKKKLMRTKACGENHNGAPRNWLAAANPAEQLPRSQAPVGVQPFLSPASFVALALVLPRQCQVLGQTPDVLAVGFARKRALV